MKNDIFADFTTDIWSPEMVQAAIAAKKLNREAKGETLNAFSLDLYNPDRAPRHQQNRTIDDFNADNLNSFVESVCDRVMMLDAPVRLQIAARVNERHWTAIDIEISPDGVKMLLSDAAGDPDGSHAAEIMYDMFVEKFPGGNNQYFSFGVGEIQYDDFSCSRFTLDHIYHLSSIDTFKILDENINNFRTIDLYNNDGTTKTLTMIEPNTLPTEMATLLKATQSKTKFNKIPEHLLQQKINKKGQSLQESELFHTESVIENGVTKEKNVAIHHKKDVYIQDVEKALQKHGANQFEKLSKGCDVLNAVEESDFLIESLKNPLEVAHGLINEASKILEQRIAAGNISQKDYLKNLKVIDQSKRQLSKNNPIKAISKLTKMKDLTGLHKNKLVAQNKHFRDYEKQYKKILKGLEKNKPSEIYSTSSGLKSKR